MPDKPTLSKQEQTKKYNKEYRLANRKKIAAQRKKYRLDNPEKFAARHKEYTLANPEKVAARHKKYRLANPEISRRHNQRYKMRKRGLASTLTIAEWQKIVDDHFGRCCYCGVKSDSLTQDHVVPVSKGGGYTAENIIPACPSCNSSKGAGGYSKFVKDSTDRLQMELL